MNNKKKQTILSGMRPSGVLHIGNYLGALKQWVEFQGKYQMFAMVADLHAITTPFEPKTLNDDTLRTAMFYIACGIDPKKSVIFAQSQVTAHTELAWILNAITPVGELERMTQFKEKRKVAGTMAGLLNYPILQAADILLYQTDLVPIGEDQVQHLEFTRGLARKFNNRFGETFKEPKAFILKETGRIMSLDNPAKKMSKSSENPNSYISLLDTPEKIKNKIMSAVTDSGREIKYDSRAKPAISNLISIFSAFSGLTFRQIEEQCAGKSYAEFKSKLIDVLVDKLKPIQAKFGELAKDKKQVLASIAKGAETAEKVAKKTLSFAKNKVGFI